MPVKLTGSGLPLIKYTTDERLNEIMEIHRRHGVFIADPHIWMLEDSAGYKSADADLTGFKREVDPLGHLQSRQDENLRPSAMTEVSNSHGLTLAERCCRTADQLIPELDGEGNYVVLMHHLLTDGAARAPDKIAFRWVDRNKTLTYAQVGRGYRAFRRRPASPWHSRRRPGHDFRPQRHGLSDRAFCLLAHRRDRRPGECPVCRRARILFQRPHPTPRDLHP